VELVVATLANRFKHVHEIIRAELAGFTPEQLAHSPGPAMNSVAVLVTHLLGSEKQIWSMVAGRDASRDRASEFSHPVQSLEELLAMLDRADHRIDELAPEIDATALASEWRRASDARLQTGIFWLIQSFGHISEHLAHLQLTKQLLADRYPPIARPW
jgi:hypothetical protein